MKKTEGKIGLHSFKSILALSLVVFQLLFMVPVFAIDDMGKSKDVIELIQEETQLLVDELIIHVEEVESEDETEWVEKTLIETEVTNYTYSGLNLFPGSNETQMNLAWYGESLEDIPAVQVVKASFIVDESFPEEHAVTYWGHVSPAVSGLSSNKVTITGLEFNTTYAYRIGNGVSWSDVISFRTHDPSNAQILLVGDPQIGASGIQANTISWQSSVEKIMERFDSIAMILSAGDQVETATNELHYDGYFSPEELKSIPVATTIGNHDNNVNYSYHFNVPNHAPTMGATNAGGNYYFTYGDALFMVLNANNRSGATHRDFIAQAIEANPNAKWRIVMQHQGLYSSANHSTSSTTNTLRAALIPVMDEFEIDVVLNGHDHSYTRSHHMKNGMPQLDQLMDSSGAVVNPTGTVYFTVNSSSGSKYYNLKTAPEPYAAVRHQFNTPTVSKINLSSDTFRIETYRLDTMEMTDLYEIKKDPNAEDLVPVPKNILKTLVLSQESSVISALPGTLFDSISLTLQGFDQDENVFAYEIGDLTYHTDLNGIIEVVNHEIRIKNTPETAVSGNIWASVLIDGQTVTSNLLPIHVKFLEEISLIEKNSVWHYMDDGSDQGTAWKEEDFDASSWQSGHGPLGYPTRDYNLIFGPISDGTLVHSIRRPNAIITYYFRKEIIIESVEEIETLSAIMGFDDGYVLYVNGQEVRRVYMPEGEINYLSEATIVNEPSDPTGTDRADLTEVVKPLLKVGKNVFAVSVHNRDRNSSDIYWDMLLVGTKSYTPAEKSEPKLTLSTDSSHINKDSQDEVVVRLNASHMKNINAMDLTLEYDEAFLRLKEVRYFNAFAVNSLENGKARTILGFVSPIIHDENQVVLEYIFEPLAVTQGGTEITLVRATYTNAADHEENLADYEEGKVTINMFSYRQLSDINGDGQVTLTDLSIALLYYSMTEHQEEWENARVADIDGNGIVDVTDFTIISMFIINK